MRLFSNANYPFVENRRPAYMISGVVLIALIVGALFFQFSKGSWLNYGVDFLGGTLVQVRVEGGADVAGVRSAVAGVAPGSEVTRFGEANDFLIRAPEFSEGGTEVADQILASLRGTFGADNIVKGRTSAVGPKIGSELQTRALFALLLSFAATLGYLAFRFEWRYGVAAIIATMHDIIITLGLISVLRLEVSLPTVAAVLTIIGYSLNDTIIVFDRIRENVKRTGRREEYIRILDRSINEVLPRTILTSGTTVATLLALYLLGGAIISDFALILILGVVIGTYSSIFVASPALLEIEERTGENRAARADRTRTAAL